MTEKPYIYGAPYSVYVRIVRLALAEKAADYELVPIDIFAKEGSSADYLDRHPFARIPAFEHAGFCLYETGAITRYVDEAFQGPPLQPVDIKERARCNQLMSIADHYAYPQMVWGVYVERVSKPKRGAATDERKLAAALPKARTCMKAISDLMADNLWLAGRQLSLADLYLAPMLDYFQMAPEGLEMVQQYPNLASWWVRIAARSSMTCTPFV